MARAKAARDPLRRCIEAGAPLTGLETVPLSVRVDDLGRVHAGRCGHGPAQAIAAVPLTGAVLVAGYRGTPRPCRCALIETVSGTTARYVRDLAATLTWLDVAELAIRSARPVLAITSRARVDLAHTLTRPTPLPPADAAWLTARVAAVDEQVFTILGRRIPGPGRSAQLAAVAALAAQVADLLTTVPGGPDHPRAVLDATSQAAAVGAALDARLSGQKVTAGLLASTAGGTYDAGPHQALYRDLARRLTALPLPAASATPPEGTGHLVAFTMPASLDLTPTEAGVGGLALACLLLGVTDQVTWAARPTPRSPRRGLVTVPAARAAATDALTAASQTPSVTVHDLGPAENGHTSEVGRTFLRLWEPTDAAGLAAGAALVAAHGIHAASAPGTPPTPRERA